MVCLSQLPILHAVLNQILWQDAQRAGISGSESGGIQEMSNFQKDEQAIDVYLFPSYLPFETFFGIGSIHIGAILINVVKTIS